jgi:hypothetical protein
LQFVLLFEKGERRMRLRIFVAAAVAALGALASAPADAGLDGKTVSAYFYFGAPSSPPPACTTTSPFACESENYVDSMNNITNSPSPNVPVDFLPGAYSESTVHVGDTKIVITNEANTPFCSTTLPCSDGFTGFAFVFSSGADITGVGVDPSSAPDFRPVGLTFDSTDIFVNLVGLTPALGAVLTLDVTAGTPVVPELSTWALMLLGFAGLGAARCRRARGAVRAG